MSQNEQPLIGFGGVIGAFVVIACIAVGGMVGCPQYSVYTSHKAGEAEFAQAEANRQILVRNAEAEKEAATFKKEAHVIEAQGVAEANKIISGSLEGSDGYLTYLYLKGLQDGNNEVIYVATEAGIPITEGGRLFADRHTRQHVDKQDEVLKGSAVHASKQEAKSPDKVGTK